MSLHLVIEDNTEDPQVPEPTVCPTCEGEGVIDISVSGRDRLGEWRHDIAAPCPDCCCTTCRTTTDTPPLCSDCSQRQDDRDAAKAYREGRYE